MPSASDHIPSRVRIRAYAKINIGLRILGKLPGGYHEIETIFQKIDLYDVVTLRIAPSISFTSDDPSLPQDETNLCVKAARLYFETSHPENGRGAKLSLLKRIPVGAGLGGGSSDAAATLTGLYRLGPPGANPSRMPDLAARIGSDVPYFCLRGAAYGTGTGTRLSPIKLKIPYWILTVFPNIHVSTAWAYRQFNREAKPRLMNGTPSKSPGLDTIVCADIGFPERLRQNICNDFEEPVFREYPAIATLKENLLDAGAVFAQLSGSGSSVYGFFRNERATRKCASQLDPSYRSFLTPPGFGK